MTDLKSSEICLSDELDFQRYFSISKEIIEKVADSELSDSIILDLISSEEYDSLYKEIGATASDITRYDSLSIYASNLLTTYSTTAGDCSLCEASDEDIQEYFVTIVGWVRDNPDDFEEFEIICDNNGTQCQWVQYIACLGACCTLPPFLNALCAAACYCEFCTRESGHPMNGPCGQAPTQ